VTPVTLSEVKVAGRDIDLTLKPASWNVIRLRVA
jgi:hypothetical protein